jgi:putative spermidine/putrescine transport system ATP-binding protein/spermidine/putrescine transport system ATP-binding protein
MVFQNYALFPHMDVARNVAYGLRMGKVPRAEIRRRVAEVLEMVKLSGYEKRRPRELSGGQQQRVALARAVVIDPDVLLLDEPLSALDKNLRASMQIELKEIQRRLGITTIFVTHDQSEALSLSDRIGVMSEGQIHQIGTPEEVYRRPATPFVASFVGDINRLPATLERVEGNNALIAFRNGRAVVPADRLGELIPARALDVFVRPQHLSIAPRPGDGALVGTVEHYVYQGSHMDMYVATPAAAAGRLHLALPDDAAPARWPAGSEVGILLRPEELLVFARGG